MSARTSGPAAAPARPLVVLVGPPGAGKSSVARELGALLGAGVRDTDADVEATAGKSITDVFVEDGEPAFRAMERAAVLRALTEHDGVLALGGGAVLDADVRAALTAHRAAGGLVVFLDVSLTAAAPRVGFNRSRPLLLGNPRARWQALMDARRPVYEAVSGARVATDDLTPGEVAGAVVALLDPPGPGRRDADD